MPDGPDPIIEDGKQLLTTDCTYVQHYPIRRVQTEPKAGTDFDFLLNTHTGGGVWTKGRYPKASERDALRELDWRRNSDEPQICADGTTAPGGDVFKSTLPWAEEPGYPLRLPVIQVERLATRIAFFEFTHSVTTTGFSNDPTAECACSVTSGGVVIAREGAAFSGSWSPGQLSCTPVGGGTGDLCALYPLCSSEGSAFNSTASVEWTILERTSLIPGSTFIQTHWDLCVTSMSVTTQGHGLSDTDEQDFGPAEPGCQSQFTYTFSVASATLPRLCQGDAVFAASHSGSASVLVTVPAGYWPPEHWTDDIVDGMWGGWPVLN